MGSICNMPITLQVSTNVLGIIVTLSLWVLKSIYLNIVIFQAFKSIFSDLKYLVLYEMCYHQGL